MPNLDDAHVGLNVHESRDPERAIRRVDNRVGIGIVQGSALGEPCCEF